MRECGSDFWQKNWQKLLTPLKEKPRQPKPTGFTETKAT